MAIINFPNAPALNDTYLFGGKTWKWNGRGWALAAAAIITAPTDASYITLNSEIGLSNELVLGNQIIMKGLLAARPAAGNTGVLYYVTDAALERMTRDNGTTWDDVTMDASFVTGIFDMGTF